MSTMTISLDDLATVVGGNDALVGQERRDALVEYLLEGGLEALPAKLKCRSQFTHNPRAGAFKKYDLCVGFSGQRADGQKPMPGSERYLERVKKSELLR